MNTQLTIGPRKILLHTPAGLKVSEIARAAGVPINLACGGKGACSTCMVQLETGRYLVSGEPLTLASGESRAALACQTVPLGDLCHITIPESSVIEKKGKIADDFAAALLAGITTDPANTGLSVAVDIGTTTVAALLLERSSGRVLARASAYNAQIASGDNVAARIAACADPAQIAHLQTLILQETIVPLIHELLQHAQCDASAIQTLAFSGNTTMTHLAMGFSPVSIGVIPFEPLYRVFPEKRAGDLGIALCPTARVTVTPAVSGYVGGDIVSDIAVTALHQRPGLSLLLDIGTNGEMVLADNGRMLATATAAGPAFEGSGIFHGMRASQGAIERIVITDHDELEYGVIGGVQPKGLCGTAVIDLIAEGRRRGWINERGRFDLPRLESLGLLRQMQKYGNIVHAILLADSDESGRDDLSPLYLTEVDVAEIIKAKAAVYAGAKALMDRMGKRWSDLDRIILSGGFAMHLRLRSAIGIGLLPDVPHAKYEMIGNGSLAGACGLALDESFQSNLTSLHRLPEVINLAETDEFEDHFIDALALPHLDEDEFPSLLSVPSEAETTPTPKN
jgi:uncharacterized 2Fe-2S/4Fe-4S cluster protein (DUF4445 family)